MTTRSQCLRRTAGVSVLLAFPSWIVLFVYPLAIFNHNAADFGNSGGVLTPFFVATGAVTLLSVAAGFLLSFARAKVADAFTAITFGLGCSFILNDIVTPVRLTKAIGFDGAEGIVPASPAIAAIGAVSLLACLGLAWWRRKTEVRRAGPAFAVLLLAITAGPDFWRFQTGTRQQRQSSAGADWISIPPVSPTKVAHPNVYHIILDGFRGSMFPSALKEAGLGNADFPGFTFYPKNRSNSDGTQASTPVFLTGTLYRGGSFRAWHNSWNDTGIFREVKTQLGTDIKAYSSGAYYQLTRWIQGRRVMKPDSVRRHRDVILHLALARATPSFARTSIYHDGSGLFSRWLISITVAGDSRLDPLELLITDDATRPSSGEYVFSHLYFPHGPFLVDRSGNASRSASLLSQSAYALRRTADFLATLRKSGRYKDSIIVIHSDHGWGDQVPATDGEWVPEGIQIETWRRSAQELDNWTSALLLIKPAGSEENPLLISPRSTQLLDLPNTIYDLVGLPQNAPEGKSVVAKNYPVDPEKQIFTGFRRWSATQKRQLWFGQDFLSGEFNHFVWTEAAGLKVLPPLAVTWEAETALTMPSKPEKLSGRRLESTVIELRWPADGRLGEYEIQMARDSGKFATIGRGGAGTSVYTVGDVAADVTYQFRARWVGRAGAVQAWSEIVHVPPLKK